MKSLEAIRTSLQEQLNGVIAVVILMLVLWLLRRQISRLLLWMILQSILDDESRQYVTKVIEKSVNSFIDRALLTLIAYIFTSFFVQNEQLAGIVNNVAFSIFLYTFFRLANEVVKSITASSQRLNNITKLDVDRTLLPLIRLVASGVIYLTALLAIAQTWDIELTTVFAGLGIGGLAVSFAAQDALKNLIGFIVVVSDKPFMLEEYISTPSAEGTVEDIGLRSVRIRCLDQSLVVIPNHIIANESVTNWSRLEKRWLNFMVALPFSTTAQQIEAFTAEVREMLQAREHVEPESVLTLFTEYDSSALNVLIRCYITLPAYVDALTERMLVNLEINRIIDRLGLRLALPAQYLTFDQVQEKALAAQPAPREPSSERTAKPDSASRDVWAAGGDNEADGLLG